jgi:hypothetical protein
MGNVSRQRRDTEGPVWFLGFGEEFSWAGKNPEARKRGCWAPLNLFFIRVMASTTVDANNILSASTMRVDADSPILLFFVYFFNKSIVINIYVIY